jgi:hypothetical protein
LQDGAHFSELKRRLPVSPAISDVIQYVGDINIGQFRMPGHLFGVLHAIDDEGVRNPVSNDTGQAVTVYRQVIGAGERRDERAETATIFQVAAGALCQIEVSAVSIRRLLRSAREEQAAKSQKNKGSFQHLRSFALAELLGQQQVYVL